ncbi:acyltransferase [Cryobacterium sp. Hz9]|uniref:acyltransferase family protein n=1 Tax=Cryobacterium sp. Hz9 TaxID=1259167 RepID=UPI0010FFDA83|nr:acyltransferase [Cryobacterium sp. Hz9]TFB71608.1 acyltransferase [Cryobacterium sp. Hz9]
MTLQTTAARPSSSAPVPTGRLTSLDGLRGVAALVVMFHHLYLVAVPSIVAAGGSQPGSVYWWVSRTPLKILTAGSEAVLVFFVLSGLVVALPALRKSRYSWAGFLSGRIARIYLPVWASLAIGTALIWLLPRDLGAVTPGSWLATSNAASTTPASLLNQMSLTAASYGVNNVLWSLRWELAFSVLLPLFAAVAFLVRRRWLLALCVALALSLLGLVTNIDALRYLPVFFVGTLMAVRLDAIREWTRRRLQRPHARLWGIVLVVGSLLLLVAGWLAQPIAVPGTLPGRVFTQLAVCGAAGLVLAAVGVPFLRRALESRPSQWLGRVSFSLYLVHVPILASLSFLLGDDKWWLVALITIPLALLVAWGFYLAFERPSHRLARHTSQIVARNAARLSEKASRGGARIAVKFARR